MRIGEQLVAHSVIALNSTPDLSVRQKETLIACEAIDDGRFFSIQGKFVSGEGHLESAEIADIFAHCELAVHTGILQWTERIVLRCEPFRLFKEFLIRLARPPVANLTRFVELTPLIVEAVAHLVTDDSADRTVVDGGVRIRIEERRLQDRGGKSNLVH